MNWPPAANKYFPHIDRAKNGMLFLPQQQFEYPYLYNQKNIYNESKYWHQRQKFKGSGRRIK